MESVYEAMAGVENKVLAQVEGLGPEQLSWKPAEDSWSILEVVGHLTDTDRDYWSKKARKIAAEDGVTLQREFDQAQLVRERGYNRTSLGQVLSLLRESRRELVEIYQSIPEAAWGNKGVFPSGTRLLRDFPPHVVRHDDSHMGQIGRVKEQLKEAGLL